MRTYHSAPELTPAYLQQVWQILPPHLRQTLFLDAPVLSQRLNCSLTIATETFQHTGNFKYRAAYNLVSTVENTHVIAASSGNFGQAVALACQVLKKRCTVVMPSTSAQVKIEAVRSYGGEVDLIDTREVDRWERVQQLIQDDPTAFPASAYDDYRVVAGNSTLGQEILQYGDFDAVVVPVGGGGLCSALVLARDYLQSSTKIFGAEPLSGNDAAQSFRTGELVYYKQEPDTIADGARTVSLGQINWEIMHQGVEDIIEVADPVTIEALRTYFRYLNLKVEPTGALSLGALLSSPHLFAGKKVCCIVSGGNVDPAVYAHAIHPDSTR